MKSIPAADPQPSSSLSLTGARVALLGDGADAHAHAHALRAAGNEVAVGVAALDGADVVVCARDEHHPSLHAFALARGTLVVFGSGLVLEACAGELQGLDIVLVTRVHGSGGAACRVAVHRDATGRALVRAIAYARAVFGQVSVELSTVATEIDWELSGIGERPGSVLALLGSVERTVELELEDPDEVGSGEWPSFASIPMASAGR